MTKNIIGTSFTALIMMLAVLTSMPLTAQADDHYDRGHSRGHSHGYYHGKGHRDDRHDDRRYLSRGYGGYGRDRVVYYTPSYIPPRQVVYYAPVREMPVYRTYRVGEFLPAHVRCVTPSRSVLGALPPARHGTHYVQADNNIYLISSATDRILDAMVLLSQVR